jgi:hypothetical protein
VIDPLAFYNVAVLMRDAASAALRTSIGGSPSVVGIVPGAISWDNCDCDGGQLSITMTRIFLSDRFPTDASPSETLHHGTVCGPTLIVAEYLVQVVRCAPQPQGSALSPSATALDQAAQVNISDSTVLANSVSCALGEAQGADQIDAFSLRYVTPQGPQGTCVGTEMLIFVSLRR